MVAKMLMATRLGLVSERGPEWRRAASIASKTTTIDSALAYKEEEGEERRGAFPRKTRFDSAAQQERRPAFQALMASMMTTTMEAESGPASEPGYWRQLLQASMTTTTALMRSGRVSEQESPSA